MVVIICLAIGFCVLAIKYMLYRKTRVCPYCKNRECIGNTSPCYSCHNASKFDPRQGAYDMEPKLKRWLKRR